jgi:hypothetical protein
MLLILIAVGWLAALALIVAGCGAAALGDGRKPS